MSLRDLRKLDRDDLLELVGLQRAGTNDWIAPALTALGVGLLVGAGLGLLLAPKPGVDLRQDLRDRLREAREALPEPLRTAGRGTEAAASRGAEVAASRSTP
jgi:hypothetical protein